MVIYDLILYTLTMACPWYFYDLSSKWMVSKSKVAVYMLQTIVLIVVSYLSTALYGVLSYNGFPLFYLAMPFYIAFIMWWGAWGMVGVYAGSFIGSGLLFGLSFDQSLVYSAVYLIASLVPFLFYRGPLRDKGIDPFFRDLFYKKIESCLTNRKAAWVWFLTIDVLLANIIGATMGVGIVYSSVFQSQIILSWWIQWLVSDALATLLLLPPLTVILTDFMEKRGTINRGLLS